MNLQTRAYLDNFIAIKSQKNISIKLAISIESMDKKKIDQEEMLAPWDTISFFSPKNFKVKIIGLTNTSKAIFVREFDSDEYASISIKIPSKVGEEEISNLLLFELNHNPGIEVYLGSFIPMTLEKQKRVLISDFDRTLVDTRYHTVKEVYKSLKSPLKEFPTIKESVKIIKEHHEDNFNIFILSASPHFYEKPIRDWLYQNKIFSSHIFLKDYRKIFSLFDSELTTKDIKQQGFYKLKELSEILLMTGIPDELVLMGDGFESDPLIYSILRAIIIERIDPWRIWREVKVLQTFKMTKKQESLLLTTLHQVSSLPYTPGSKFEIYIRYPLNTANEKMKKSFDINFLQAQTQFIHHYRA